MPGTSLVAAVVSPDVLEALPGDKDVFFGMLHLECGTSCTKADGQWAQVKDAVMLLDIIDKSKNSNETLIDRAYFDDPKGEDDVNRNTGKKKGGVQQTFVVEWTSFFGELQKDFPQLVIEKFKRIVTAALRKEKESQLQNVVPRRSLTRRKGLPHRLQSTNVENPLATALAIAFESERQNSAGHNPGDCEDALSVDSADSVDIQQALEDNADEEYTTKRKVKGRKSKKAAGNDDLAGNVTRRDGKSKTARIDKRSADVLNKILRNLTAEIVPLPCGDAVENNDNVQRSGDGLVLSASEMVFPSRSEEDHHHVVYLSQDQVPLPQQQEQQLGQPLSAPIYRCPICSTFTAESKGAIKIHAYSMHLAASYRCVVCKGVFSSKLALERHRLSHRQETFPFLKCLCSRILTSRSGLTRHIASCQSLLIGARLVDDPTAADRLNLNIAPYVTYDADGHPKKTAGRRPRPDYFICDICRIYSASSGPTLVHHKLITHPAEALRCSSCPWLTFKDFAEFYEHNSLHITKLPCENCGKVFSNVRSYEMHLKTHESGFEKAAFVCTLCARAFTTAYVLKYHMQHSHLDLARRFHCMRCGRAFSQKIHLIEHLYSHDGLKPYMCDFCGRGFSHQTSLQQHKLTHGEETRYKCEDCPKSFRTRASLIMHRNCHTERKHQCQFCGKLFTQKTARIRHERIHTGEQPYKCTFCNKAFSDSSVLRRHLLVHDPRHLPKRPPVAPRKLTEIGLNVPSTSMAANEAVESSIVDLTSVVSTSQVARKVVKPRASRANKSGNRIPRSRKIAPNLSNNLPLVQFEGSSAFCQPQASIDSALDLHLFSPMSVLVPQPPSSMAMQPPQQQVLITNESCPSPETPPPISVPDLHNVVDDSRLFHHQQSQNLIFNSQPQRAHENATSGNSQQYHVIQLSPEAVQIVQMTGPSNLSARNSGNTASKFSSYIQQQQEQSMSPSNSDVVESSALLRETLQCSASGNSGNNQTSSLHHSQQQQMYNLGSQMPTVDLIGPDQASSALPPFFLSSDGSASGTLFAVPAEAFFGLQSQQQAESPSPPHPQQHHPPACSYQFSDMQLVDNQPQQQHDQQILYQPVSAAAFFANMDGTAVPISLFSEQFGSGMGSSGRQLLNINHLMGEMPSSSMPEMNPPLLQMPPPLVRPQNAHQRVSNPHHYL